MSKSKIENIDNKGLCLGCGLCESICGKDNVEMKLGSDGFFHPEVKNITKEEEIIQKICPSINVENDIHFSKEESVWGKIESLYSSFSTDLEIEKKGSSGGTISGVCVYLLETKTVDAVLQVGGDTEDFTRNTLKISLNRNDVLTCASSRYAPALIFDKILEILESSEMTFAFVGKPCDISGIKNFLNQYPQYKNRIKLTIAIVCAGMPSVNATEKLINDFKPSYPVKNLFYRGNGWPGFFSFVDNKLKTYSMSYNDSWGKVLGKQIHFRCKICPDGIGLQADLAVGDAWETKDGYPNFAEKSGRSLLIVRTGHGQKVIDDMTLSNNLIIETLQKEKIKVMQPYQYTRRKMLGARLLAVTMAKGVKFNFQKVHILHNTKSVSFFKLFREFVGTFKRSIK